MERVVNDPATPSDRQRRELIALFDASVDDVFGYLSARCGSVGVAEDLTSETFLAACDAVRRGSVPDLTVAWLVGVARHKLVDHWRRAARDRRKLEAVASEPVRSDEPWDVHLDVLTARRTLADLGAHHRSALTLRYVDGLSVREVASTLDRTVHATEALLVRARRAFRELYEAREEVR